MTRPSLLLNFAQTKRLDPRITFTRSTIATCITAFGLVATAAANTPRFDYDPLTGVCKGLLIEEARTNLRTESNNFADAGWNKVGCSITPSAATGPDGTTSASKLVEASGAGVKQMYRGGVSYTSGTTYTNSIYAKAGERGYLYVATTVAVFPTGSAYFDLVNGVVGTTAGALIGNAKIQKLPNGWYRCTVIATANSTITSIGFEHRPSVTGADLGSYTGDGTSGLYIYGMQTESGAFETSYIPAGSTTVTRAADVSSMTGSNFSSWYRPDEGTFVTIAQIANVVSGNNQMLARVSNATYADAMVTNFSGTGTAVLASVVGGSSVASISGGSAGTNAPFRVAIAYKTNDYAISLNGAAAVTDSSGAVPSGMTRLDIGGDHVPAVANGIRAGHIAMIAYYPVRLTNAQLQGLTL